MLIKSEVTEAVIKFLKEDYITNLNILGVLENSQKAQVYVDDCERPTGILVRENQYMHYLYSRNDSFLSEVADNYLKDGFYGFAGVEVSIAEKLLEKLKYKGSLDWVNPCNLYYMPKENLDLSLIKNQVSPIALEDAEEVNKYYTYRSDTSLQTIKNDISKRPSSAVYVNGEIACWVLIHGDNSMGILYSKEKFRRNGYAIDVTIDLASKIIEAGKVPFVHIVTDNQKSPGVASKCGFIQHGSCNWFGIIAGSPEPLVKGAEEGKKQFLNIIGEELDSLIFGENANNRKMYLTATEFNNCCHGNEGLHLVKAEDQEHINKWCKAIAKLYDFDEAKEVSFTERISIEMAKENPELVPLLAIRGDEVIALSALVKADEEAYGLYLIDILEEDSDLLKQTLEATLKWATGNNGEIILAECSEDREHIYKGLGFRVL